jgi:hypothetical protein
MRILILILALITPACASVLGEGQFAFRTVEECRIARRLGRIDDETLFNCYVDLPETIF